MRSRFAACVLIALMAPAGAVAQTAPAPLTTAELGGDWTLTFRPIPPDAKGPRVVMKDKSGRELQELAFNLSVQRSGSRLTTCRLTVPDRTDAEPAACRLERGRLVLQVAMSGSGGGPSGTTSVRLERTASGAIAGPVRVRAPLIPVGLSIGTATLTRPG